MALGESLELAAKAYPELRGSFPCSGQGLFPHSFFPHFNRFKDQLENIKFEKELVTIEDVDSRTLLPLILISPPLSQKEQIHL